MEIFLKRKPVLPDRGDFEPLKMKKLKINMKNGQNDLVKRNYI